MKDVACGVNENGEIKYKQVPEMANKYYYKIEKFVYDRSLETSGSNTADWKTEPYFGEVELTDDERISCKNAYYKGTFKNLETGEIKTFSLTKEQFDILDPLMKVSITTTKFDGDSIKNISIL